MRLSLRFRPLAFCYSRESPRHGTARAALVDRPSPCNLPTAFPRPWSAGPAAVPFFVVLILLVPFFAINLVLAVIFSEFAQAHVA